MSAASVESTVWRTVGASVVGDRHLVQGVPCQDAFRTGHTTDGAWVAAVADGVSVAEASACGSTLAVELAVRQGLARLGEDDWPEDAQTWHRWSAALVEDINTRLRAIAAVLAPQDPESGRRLRTTLAFAVIAGPWCVVTGVGDCVGIIARQETNSLHCVLTPWPPGCSPENPETLPAVAPEPRCLVIHDAGIDAVLLATDGLAGALLDSGGTPTERPHDGLVRPVLDHIQINGDPHALVEMLLMQDELRNRTGDDRTLAVVLREEEVA